MHGLTRKRTLVDTFFSLGMCVSYDRLLQITADMAEGINCTRFEADNVVCPPKMRRVHFTTGAVDNVDHNPTSAAARDSCHGTSISIIQHLSHESTGIMRDQPAINQESTSARSVPPLPSSYTSVPPAALNTKEFKAPVVDASVRPPDLRLADEAKEVETKWLTTLWLRPQMTILLLSCPLHNVLPLVGACLCPPCHCGQVISHTGLVK